MAGLTVFKRVGAITNLVAADVHDHCCPSVITGVSMVTVILRPTSADLTV
jgi:formylmethanofuran dehydrogenase subunit E-like metal-binding protein